MFVFNNVEIMVIFMGLSPSATVRSARVSGCGPQGSNMGLQRFHLYSILDICESNNGHRVVKKVLKSIENFLLTVATRKSQNQSPDI